MKVDLEGFEAFVAVAEHGSFSKAAAQLHITQTALTRRIQKFELALGLKVLDRSTRHVALSSVGREFLPEARAILRDVRSSVERLSGVSRNAGGQVTLACLPSMTLFIIPEIVRRYAAQHPANHIRLLDGSSHEVRDSVLTGRAEIGLAIGGEKHPELSESLLFEDALYFICREPHPLQSRKQVTWADMRAVDLITISGFSATRVVMDYQLAKHGIRVSGKYEVQHHGTAINLVAAGVGSAILPGSALPAGERLKMRRIALVNPVVKRRVVLLRRRNVSLSPPAQAIVDVIEKMRLRSS